MTTILDVARDVGVSPSTVSYAISGKRRISEETRRRVAASMQKLGYVPRNHTGPEHARATRKKPVERGEIALFAPLRPGVDRAIIMGFIDCIIHWANSYGFNTLLFTEDDEGRSLKQVSREQQADALIVMDIEAMEPRVSLLRASEHPAVLIGLPDDPRQLHCVDFDFSLAGARAAQYLADHGHGDVGFIGSPTSVYQRGTTFARSLLMGFRRTAQERRLTVSWTPCELDPTEPGRRLDALLHRLPRMSGLVVHNEAALTAVLLELERRNLRVPHDVTVVAVLPDEMARSYPDRIVSVQVPVSDISRTAVRTAVAQLHGQVPPAVRLLPPQPLDSAVLTSGEWRQR